MGAVRIIIAVLLSGCLAAAIPLAIESNPPLIKADESASLEPAAEAREDPAMSQKPTLRQFGVAIPELQHSQFQSSDGNGRYSFGYAYPEQVHMESRGEDGQVRGAYFYKDPNGNPNEVLYLADNDGFRVSANNLPVFQPGQQPEPVKDTPEVEEAKRKHLETWAAVAKHNEAQSAKYAAEKQSAAVANTADSAPKAEDIVPVVAVAAAELPVNEQKAEEAVPEVAVVAEVAENVQNTDDNAQVVAVVAEEPQAVSATDNMESSASAKVSVAVPSDSPFIKPVDLDITIDEENQAVITEQDKDSDPENASLIEIDAEPIRLLAQLYAKHIQDNSEPPQVIDRPAGFHPQNLQLPTGFDLFSRIEGDDRDAVEVINPEYVDLRAFLLTNRFRGAQQLVIRTEDKPVAEKPSDDLFTSDQPDPSTLAAYTIPQSLFNNYYGYPYSRPLFLTRDRFDQLPESLKLAITGAPAPDGMHDAQAAPSQVLNRRQQMLLQRLYSPYSPEYSPYYFYRNAMNSYYNPYANPYYPEPMSPYMASPYNYNYHPYYFY